MKKLILSILISSISFTVISQGCLPEGITFTTQEQIDNFQTDYPGCTEIEGDVTIVGDDITNLTGLNDVTSIGGGMQIGGRSYYHYYNPMLISLEGLNNLTNISESLIIHGNSSLTTFTGLGNLNSVGSLAIVANNKLADLSGLNKLSSVGDVWIGGYDINPPYTEIQCGGNSSLSDISALSNLTSISSLSIYCNDSLIDLAGLENLNTIENGLKIGFVLENELEFETAGNPILMTISGLVGLTSIGSEISIQGNEKLEDLEGLNNIDETLIDSLTIKFNLSLSNCEVQCICDYLVSPNGTFSISNNAEGCNSEQEVEEACSSSINENSTIYGIKTQPNPFSSSTTIEYELKQPEHITLTIYDYLGKQVYQTQENQQQGKQQLIWNAVKYSDGVYYFNLNAGEQVARGKLVLIR